MARPTPCRSARRTRGLELEAMASLGRMDLVATYTYLNPKITKGTAAD